MKRNNTVMDIKEARQILGPFADSLRDSQIVSLIIHTEDVANCLLEEIMIRKTKMVK